MDLIDRLRPRWRHPDPDVRAAAVRDLAVDDRDRLGTIAQSDPDARVRRVAIKKLEDTALLESLAANDADPALRTLAAERLREVLVAAAGGAGPVPACEAALARLADERSLAAVASAAVHEPVRQAALSRIATDRVLRDVVRGADDPAIRLAALERIADAATLRSLACGELAPDLAVRAVERIGDLETLRAIAENRSVPKGVRQRARALLPPEAAERKPLDPKEARARQLELSVAVHALRAERDLTRAAEQTRAAQEEWQALAREIEPREDVAERFAAACDAILEDAASLDRRRTAVDRSRAELEEGLAARAALCTRVEEIDGADAVRRVAEARAAWQRLAPVADERGAALARRFALACDGAAARHQQSVAQDARRAQLTAVVEEAEALAAAAALPGPKAWKAVERRWTSLEPSRETSDETATLARRMTAAGERLRRRWQESEQHRGEQQRENLARLEALCSGLQTMAGAEAVKPGAVRRELQAAEAALADLGPLPPSERRAAWVERLSDAHAALLRRMRQEEEAEEWRRWANVGAQEELIARVEALLESNDLAEGTRRLGTLQEEWAKVATASPEKSQALWERFRTARNELRRRCDAYLAENLEKKRALVAQVAGLGESTAWNETADLIRRVQAEWKEIGPVPAKHSAAIWQQFREPADRFFARRKEHFGKIDDERRENAARKLALCEQAEALADSTDWEATTAAVKQLQAEWKRSGPPPRDQTEVLWQRFRTACDRFFDRRSRRGELAREEAQQKAQAICEELEAAAAALAGEDVPAADATGRRMDEAWADWCRLDDALVGDVSALAERVRAACERIAAAQPESLRGTRLDPEATRKRREKLCARLEEMVAATSGTPRQLSLQEMALALRDRLASNTIAGAASRETGRGQDTTREIERLAATWDHLGPALDADARALAERFERARARLRETSK
jgi:hypothetical protein